MRKVLPFLLVIVLAACTTPIVQTDVTRFHALAPVGPAPSFTIVPQERQAGSLEFERYADLVAAELERRGWRPVPPGGDAQALVRLSWGVGQPRIESYQTPSAYGSMGWGPHSRWYGAGIGLPLGDPFPYWETRTATYFPRWLSVEIVDSGTRRVLFEGRAVAEGSKAEIAPVMPYLAQALFTGFPGSSGQTVRVNVPR